MANEHNSMSPQNYLKVRDDREPFVFQQNEAGNFLPYAGETLPWDEEKTTFKTQDLRVRIEPWLTSLFQSDHLSLLVGSGLTHAVHTLAQGSNAATMTTMRLSVHSEKINKMAVASSKKAGRAEGNIEDQLRTANELLRGLEILEDSKADSLRKEIDGGLNDFAESILKSEAGIVVAEESKREKAFGTLVMFLMSFASRTGTRDRLSIFTTNYDRIIEAGAELAGIHLLDRFIGSLAPIFRSSRLDLDMHYNPPGIRGEPRYLEGVARFTKLHGSVDWVQTDNDIRRIGLPLGAESITPYIQAHGLKGETAHRLMIYPNASKDRETSEYPYVDLFRDFAAAVCRPNSTLVTYGYSFGDDHINRIMRDMLTIPSTHLVLISYNDPLGRIIDAYDKLRRPSQISLLVGPALAELATLTENYLPKAAIDKTTIRMSELLQQRFHTHQAMEKPGTKDANNAGIE
jgi:hypothetical protein